MDIVRIRRTRHRAGPDRPGAGRRRAGDGCLSSGRQRAVSGAARAHALRQIGAEPLRAHRCRRARPARAPRSPPISCAHGYAVVYQDCRGRYKSGGRFTKYLSEAEDGYDTLAWLMRQSWCNGRIGTFGLSYAAHTQAALGCLDPPGLAAQFLDCGGFSNAYRSGIRHGGAFDLKQATWAYNNALADAKDPAVKAALRAQDIKDWFARMPWRKGHSPVSAAPEYEDYLFEQWSHGIFDDFWKQPGIYAEGYYDRYAEVPVVNLSGWYDPYARTAVDNYLGLSRAEARPGAADPRPVDPWRPLVDLCRRCRFRPGGAGRRQSRRGFLRIAPALVRPLGQGRRQRRRDGAAGAGLCDGRRIGTAQRRGPARSWRPLADGRRLAAAARPSGRNSTCTPIAVSALTRRTRARGRSTTSPTRAIRCRRSAARSVRASR